MGPRPTLGRGRERSQVAKKRKDDLWNIHYGDDEFVLRGGDLTVGVFRQFSQWYGPAYGKYATFIALLVEGDADAWACAIWLVHRAAGVKCARPQNLDFAVSDVMMKQEQDEDEFVEDEDEDEEPVSPDPTSPDAQSVG
jgi:hypothetical protein